MEFVVSRRREGFGDCLRQAMFASHYARQHNATLIIDWRKSRYHINDAINMFGKLFETPDLGVPLICGDSVHVFRGTKPIVRISNVMRQGASIYEAGARANTVVFNNVLCGDGIHGAGVSISDDDYDEFFTSLKLQPRFADVLAQFEDLNFARRPVGLHIRSGNGEFRRRKSACCAGAYEHRVIDDMDWFIRNALHAIGNEPIYLSTDSIDVRERVTKIRPDAIVYPMWMPPPGCGPNHLCPHLSPSCIDTAADVLIDMMLIGRCERVYKGKYGVYCGFAFTKHGPPVYNLALNRGETDSTATWTDRG